MPGVYISYPFCRQKCSFCNFASDVAPAETRTQYEDKLIAELESCRWPWTPETVYLGGGTPSLMSGALLRRIRQCIPSEHLIEFTIECAPGTLMGDSLPVWRQAGIDRVSLGVQSFRLEELRLTGRRHSAETVHTDLDLLRAHGFENVNLDLIAGLPEQTAESWEVSLDWIERLAPPHVSVYIFESDEESRLGRELSLGGVRYGAAHMPSDEAAATFYERAVERLASMGLERYEISNFARPGFESHHNLKYWRLEPYLGFGLDAHSYDGIRRWGNSDALPDYLQPARERSHLSETVFADHAEERFFVGLRLTAGIEPTCTEWQRFAEPIAKWIAAGMLERDGPRLRLSHAGVLLSNEVFQDFVGCPELIHR